MAGNLLREGPAGSPLMTGTAAGRSSNSTGGRGAPAARAGARSHSRQRSGSAATTSIGRRARAVDRRAARSAARPSAWAPSAAAISGASPCASAVPTSPLSTSPLPPVASPGLPAATVSGGRPSRAITVGTPLSSTVAPERRRRLGRGRPGIELAHGRERRETARETRRDAA